MSSERESSPEDLNPASNTGGDDADDEGDSRAEKTQVAVDHDTWTIESGYFVRKHRLPRTTLFGALDVPDDPPPNDVKHIEVLRVTNPRFARDSWPKYDCVEDCSGGRPSDAKSLQNPLSGATLTWTGETLFGRVMPKAPKGKAWYNGGLVRVRRGSKRSSDVHPLVWWLMSEKTANRERGRVAGQAPRNTLRSESTQYPETRLGNSAGIYYGTNDTTGGCSLSNLARCKLKWWSCPGHSRSGAPSSAR